MPDRAFRRAVSRQQRHHAQDALAQETARLICEERITDYRSAKHKALQRLGLGPHTPLPDNLRVRDAVIEYQRLFGGARYVAHLDALRRAAVQAMTLLASFQPQLVGGAVSGAVTLAHRAQLHAFAERPESLELFLQNRGIAVRQQERSYRYPDGREQSIPLVCLEAGGVGLDIAVFDHDGLRRIPLDPVEGTPYRRFDLAAVQALMR